MKIDSCVNQGGGVLSATLFSAVFLSILCMLPCQGNAQIIDSSLIKKLMRSNDESKLQLTQLNAELQTLRTELIKKKQSGTDKFSSTSLLMDAVISTTNNLQSLVFKESYRNRIASLNNPASNELGFSLELEIQNSLKPLLNKVKKTDPSKFSQVVSSFLQTGNQNPLSLFPAGNVFTSIIGMVGNLTVAEKRVGKDDLDAFIRNIEKYFNQYERLYQANVSFNKEMEKIKDQLRLLQDDIRMLIQDLILVVYFPIKREAIKSLSIEELMLQYFDSRKLAEQIQKSRSSSGLEFPNDAIKSCKEICSDIHRIYSAYAGIYHTNFHEIRSIIADMKNVSATVNQNQLGKTLKELEFLFNDSRNSDSSNLRLKTLAERLEEAIK
ncbi:MAG TPA: hypothetical protein VFR58_08735 [Flavisolibacter sp.]|nr:hypothetical protein [Flavisolibacter sp.]